MGYPSGQSSGRGRRVLLLPARARPSFFSLLSSNRTRPWVPLLRSPSFPLTQARGRDGWPKDSLSAGGREPVGTVYAVGLSHESRGRAV